MRRMPAGNGLTSSPSTPSTSPQRSPPSPPSSARKLTKRTAFGRFHRVPEQHGAGGRADAADPRRDPPGPLFAPLVDVGQQPAAAVPNPGADHETAGIDVLGLDDAAHAG